VIGLDTAINESKKKAEQETMSGRELKKIGIGSKERTRNDFDSNGAMFVCSHVG
jgi:hypothetical protein